MASVNDPTHSDVGTVHPVRGGWRERRFTLDQLDRWIVVVASLAYGVAWGWRTRPMGDSADYRLAGRVITSGWEQLTDRTPGYPLVLWATGSLDGETTALFVLQLLMHAASVLIVLRVLRALAIGWRGRSVAALALFAPAGMLAVVAAGTEATVQLLVTATLGLFVRWYRTRGPAELLAIGVLFAALTWVRPSYAPVVVAVALVLWFVARPEPLAVRLRQLAALLLPAALGIGLLVGIHAVRFDHAGLTPLTGWYLGSRTSGYVERLPERYEPARRILVAERDRQVLLDGELDAPNYSFAVRDELQQALGMDRAELDDHMLEMNLYLITRHPFEYQAAVSQSVLRYTDVDSQPGVSRLPTVLAWTSALVHLGLLVAFAIQLCVVPGLALVRRWGGRPWATWSYCLAVSAAVMAVSVMTETGTPRLRTPTEPLLVIVLVLGWWALWSARPSGPAPDAGGRVPNSQGSAV